MKTSEILSIAAVTAIALVTGCASNTSNDDTDQGAVAGGTRCGPPRGSEDARAQTRCVEPQELASRQTVITVEADTIPGKYTYRLEATTASGKVAFLYPEKPYNTKAAAEEGVSALLRAALSPAAFVIDEIDREHQALFIKARNGTPLAISTLFQRHEKSAVVSAVQKALSSADIAILSEVNRSRWAFEPEKKSFRLIAGNGQTLLESAPLAEPLGPTSVDDAVFSLHELVARDYGPAQAADTRRICDDFLLVLPDGGGPREATVSASIGLAESLAGGTPTGSAKLVITQNRKVIAESARSWPIDACPQMIDAARTLTKVLSSMPRG